MRKILSAFFIMLMCALFAVCGACAEGETVMLDGMTLPLLKNDQYIYTELNTDEAAILLYIGDSATADLRSAVPGRVVTMIHDGAFMPAGAATEAHPANEYVLDGAAYRCQTSVGKVHMPSTLRSIGAGAFYGCKQLTEIALPPSVHAIAPDAFEGCRKKLTFQVVVGTSAAVWAEVNRLTTKIITPVMSIALKETDVILENGGKLKPDVTISPANATNKRYELVSTNPEVAKIVNSTILAKNPGTCEIICTASDGYGAAAICTVTVTQRVVSLTVPDEELILPLGQTVMPPYTISPANATNQAIISTPSREGIVVGNPDGTITAVGSGRRTVTVASAENSRKNDILTVYVPVFDQPEIEVWVTEPDGLTIAVDLHGFPVDKINHKAGSTRFFSYKFDDEGLHIKPLSMGKGTVLLTSGTNKKDQCIYIIAIMPSAVPEGK